MKKLHLKIITLLLIICIAFCACSKNDNSGQTTQNDDVTSGATLHTTQKEVTTTKSTNPKTIAWDDSFEYAKFSKIHSDTCKLYYATDNPKNIVVCINAGHGTKGGASVYTQCHPDGSAKVTGGSTAKGSTKATAVAGGTTLLDGTDEATANLNLAKIVKDTLLNNGYDVLMIRESGDVQFDNIARTVIANEYADCHISLHYDSTTSDKGLFYIGVPDVESYKNMEPVKSHWRDDNALGDSLVAGEKDAGVKIYNSGYMGIDLTQTSYSTIPTTDLEVGDRASDCSKSQLQKIANGILIGINNYYKQ